VAIKDLRTLEQPRCIAVHSAISQFVVFQQSADMNIKYDINQFAKVLDAFSITQEMSVTDNHLFGCSLSILESGLDPNANRSQVKSSHRQN
jgi:hypothetical protein